MGPEHTLNGSLYHNAFLPQLAWRFAATNGRLSDAIGWPTGRSCIPESVACAGWRLPGRNHGFAPFMFVGRMMQKTLFFMIVPWLVLLIGMAEALADFKVESQPPANAVEADAPAELSDAELKRVLKEAFETDQQVRKALTRAMESGDPDKVRAIVEQMRRTDRENQEIVGKILDRHGWLPASRIGRRAADGLFFIVQHSSVETIEEFLPQLQVLARRGEARTTHAAMMEDRLLMYRGRKQIYGTQACRGRIWPIANVAGVNERREKAGFDLTVEQNARRLGATFDPDEALPEEPECVVS